MHEPDPGANSYYRLEVPMTVAFERGLARVFIQDMKSISSRKDALLYQARSAHAEVNMFYGAPGPSLTKRVKFLRSLKPGRSGVYKQVRTRPAIIWTLDDDYHHVHPLNQAFLWNGYQLPGGKVLGRGDDVEIQMPDGSTLTLWKYGFEYKHGKFLPEKNRKRILNMDDVLRMSDGVAFTTKELEQAYVKSARLTETYVYPNSIYYPHWETLPNPRFMRDPGEIRVLWQGGSSHFGDLMSIKPAMLDLLKQYPKLKFIMWGARFGAFDRGMDSSQFEFLPWSPYSAYKQVLATLDFDFAIAPLVPSEFNQGKSCIKVYEPAALPTPKPTLCADVLPYSAEMVNGVNAAVYKWDSLEDFKQKFSQLVDNEQYRKTLAKNAADWVRENRNAEVTTTPYLEWCEDVRKGLGSGGVSQKVAELMVRGW